ncbi:MAG: CpsB/CapC family capsule biosynthesis tyrosine phosphatase [Acidobacteriota bacterium]
MIDIHHHCLPGVDDGPREWSEAVDLCRMAEQEGVDTIVATPHVLRGRWVNSSRAALQATLEILREKLGEHPRVLLGSEYFFAHDMTEILASGTGIIPIADSRYVLVEFAAHAVPPMIEQAFYRVQLEGWTPIIAHPERNLVFQSKPDLLATLVRLGARAQVTCASLLGDFGPKATSAANAWIGAGLVHFIATDAHNLIKRRPRAEEAMRALTDLAGERVARALTHDNPAAVIADKGLPFEPDIIDTAESTGLLRKAKKFFGYR